MWFCLIGRDSRHTRRYERSCLTEETVVEGPAACLLDIGEREQVGVEGLVGVFWGGVGGWGEVVESDVKILEKGD